MKTERILFFISAISLVVVGMSVFVYFNQPSLDYSSSLSNDQISVVIKSRQQDLSRAPNDPQLGNLGGNVTLIEFFDYRCSYCKAIHPKIMKLLENNGHIRYVAKEFPILGPVSVLASKAALASQKQGLYGQYNSALMAAKGLNAERVFSIAEHIGLDVARLRKDMETYSDEIETTLKTNRDLAGALHLKGTPAFIVGTVLIPGSPRIEGLKRIIAKVRPAD